jgi:hypothetical protein
VKWLQAIRNWLALVWAGYPYEPPPTIGVLSRVAVWVEGKQELGTVTAVDNEHHCYQVVLDNGDKAWFLFSQVGPE